MRKSRTAVSRSPRILIIDDEESFHRSIGRYLENYRLLHTYTGSAALEALEQHAIDVVLLDLTLPDYSGLELLIQIRTEAPDIQIIVITASAAIATAVAAVKAGAFDFLTKRHENYQALSYHVDRALAHRTWERQNKAQSPATQTRTQAFELMERSHSSALRATLRLARKTAGTPLSVLIEGPSGCGKELMARYVHGVSNRSQKQFVAVNVAAVPEPLMESLLFGHAKGAFTGAIADHVGKFELASGGTLFLDEIGDLPRASQAKLLRVLQEREVERVGDREARAIDSRVIVATNRNLKEEVAAGRFREDLYYRLNGIRLGLPCLSERSEDIPDLIELLARKSAHILGTATPTFDPGVRNVLTSYHWPGNIRELENLVMRLVATCEDGKIISDDIPPEYWLPELNKEARKKAASREAEGRLYFLARDQFERYLVRHAVGQAGGNMRKAARELGVSYSTVKEKCKSPPSR